MAEKKKWYQKLWDGTGSGFVRRWLVYAIIFNVVFFIIAFLENKPTELTYEFIMTQTILEFVGVGIISAIKENKKDE